MTKCCWSILTILVVLSADLLFAGQSYPATQTSPTQGTAMGAHPDAGSPEADLQWLSENLNLTDDQKAKLKPILEEQAQQMKAVRDDTSLSEAEGQNESDSRVVPWPDKRCAHSRSASQVEANETGIHREAQRDERRSSVAE